MTVKATYQLLIDLNNDGDFSDAGEDVTASVNTPGGGVGVLVGTDRGADKVTAMSPPKAGALDAQLDNSGGSFGPSGNLQPGRAVRLKATYSASTRNLWHGVLQRPRQAPAAMRKAVDISAYGVLSQLVGKRVSTALHASVTTDVALDHLLDAAGLTGPTRTFDTGKTTLEWYWEDDADAFEAMLILLYTEGPGAKIYEAGDGSIVFKHRTARAAETRSTTSQRTLRGSGSEPLISHPYQFDPGISEVINEAVLTVKKRSAGALGVAWTLGESITLSPGEERTYVARAADDDPMTAAVTPVAATDYTLSSGSLSSVTIDRTSGASIAITLVAGASGAAMPDLQLRAQVVAVTNTYSVRNSVDASASISAYGLIPWPLASRYIRPEIGQAAAQGAADAIVAWYKEGRPSARVTVKANRSDAAMLAALDSEISAPLTHVTTFLLNKALAANYGIWDLSDWDGGDFWAW